MPVISLRGKLASGLAAAFAVSTLILGFAHAGETHSHRHMSADSETSGLIVTKAMSPAPPPGIKTSAVYLELRNTSGGPIDLVAVESPAFAMAHLHKTSTVDGLMTMEAVAQLSIPEDESVTFAPGGLHIMLMGAKTSLSPGDSFPLTMVFGTGAALEFAVAVTPPGSLEAGDHDHGSMKMN